MPRRASETVQRAAAAAAPAPLALSLDALIARRLAQRSDQAVPAASAPWAGSFRARSRGRGLEVDEQRAYLPGDDPRHIDWKTSARLGMPHTRLYREERDHALSVVLDLRDTLFTGSHDLRARRAALHAATRVWQGTNHGGRVMLVVFDADGVHRSMSARSERGALSACSLLHARYAARLAAVTRLNATLIPPSGQAAAAAPGLSMLIDRLLPEGRRLGSVHLVSALDDALLDTVSQALLQHELQRLRLAAPVTVAFVDDELEQRALPAGTYRYRGHDGVARLRIDAGGAARLKQTLLERRAALEAVCSGCGVQFCVAHRQEDVVWAG